MFYFGSKNTERTEEVSGQDARQASMDPPPEKGVSPEQANRSKAKAESITVEHNTFI